MASSDSVTQRARSLLFGSSADADLLQSFIGSQGEGATPRLTLQLPAEGRRPSEASATRRTATERRRSSAAPQQQQPKKNTPFAQMTKDIKMRRIQQQQQELQMLLRSVFLFFFLYA
jgi:hypothetical protein